MASWRESKEKWLLDDRSKLADASPLTTQRAWLHTADRSALGPRRGDKPQCSLNPSCKDTYFQWFWKFSNGIVIFWNGSNSGWERLFNAFFLLIARGCRKPWCKNRCRGITGRCPSKIFLFPFIKHAVLNGKTAHTKGCLENRCAFPFATVYIFNPFTATGYFDIPPPRWPTFLVTLFPILKEGMGLSLLDEFEVQYHVIKK